MCGCLSHAPTRDLAHNPGMCPDWELNWRPLICRPVLNPLSPTSWGSFFTFVLFSLLLTLVDSALLSLEAELWVVDVTPPLISHTSC